MVTYTQDQLRRAFEQVQGHVMELHARWALFRKLYRGNADSVPILTAVGGEMFWVLGRLLHRGSLLLFRQLTDGPLSMGERNASFEGLLDAVAGADYKTAHPDLAKHVADLRAMKVIRTHTNKYIAHLDFDLLAGVAPSPPSIAILEFEDALRIMRELITEIGARFFKSSPVPFEEGAGLMIDQATDLVRALEKGLES